MPIPKRRLTTRLQRNLRLLLSDFFSLIVPAGHRVYTWKEIAVGLLLISLILMGFAAASM